MATIPFDLLALFVAVADSGSFSAAARKLGRPKSSVSRGVAQLEEAVGVRLLHRSTRRVALSTAGSALRARVAPGLTALADALAGLPELGDQPSGTLRVAASVDFGAVVLADVVARFVARYPAVDVDLRLSNALVDVVADGFDAAVRLSNRPLADSSLLARRLAPLPQSLFAAPEYLARRGTPKSPKDLDDADWVLRPGAGVLKLDGPDGAARVQPRGRIVCDDMSFIHQAVRAGAGFGVLPGFLVDADCAAGKLVRVLPRWTIPVGHAWFVMPSARQVPRKVAAFRDFLVEALQGRVL
jgi:DNA-binding transcriptional LysR family regulator